MCWEASDIAVAQILPRCSCCANSARYYRLSPKQTGQASSREDIMYLSLSIYIYIYIYYMYIHIVDNCFVRKRNA